VATLAVHYYVWYRLHGTPAAAMPGITALQDDVAARTGIRGRVLSRRDAPDTWMEIYEGVASPDTFEAALAAAVERHHAADFAQDRIRHTEAFVASS
jgi:Domain of unknown function (DUF4936)